MRRSFAICSSGYFRIQSIRPRERLRKRRPVMVMPPATSLFFSQGLVYCKQGSVSFPRLCDSWNRGTTPLFSHHNWEKKGGRGATENLRQHTRVFGKRNGFILKDLKTAHSHSHPHEKQSWKLGFPQNHRRLPCLKNVTTAKGKKERKQKEPVLLARLLVRPRRFCSRFCSCL